MGVNPVQNHPDVPGVGLPAQLRKVLLGTQHGVRSFVVAGVVAVGGEAFADGVQIQNGGTKRSNIVQFFGNTPEVAPKEIVVMDNAMCIGLPADLLVPVIVDGIGTQLSGAVAPARPGEPVREDLVDERALGPFRGVEVPGDAAELPVGALLHAGIVPLFQQPEAAVGVGDAEEIKIQSPILQPEGSPPILIRPYGFFIGHGDLGKLLTVLVTQNDVGHPGQYRRRNMHPQSAFLPGFHAPKRALVLRQLAVEQDSHMVLSPCVMDVWMPPQRAGGKIDN